MTKTLTDKWRNGTLEQKYYYVKYFGNGQKPFVEIELKNFLLDLVKVKDSDKIEVLAAVPTYDEFIQQRDFVKDHLKVLIENMNLKRKLEIATKALKDYADRDNYHDFDDDYDEPIWNIGSPIMHAELALKKIDLVGTSEKEEK